MTSISYDSSESATTMFQRGENGLVEHGWSNDMQEKIAQFSFQLTRTDEHGVHELSMVLDSLLTELAAALTSHHLASKEHLTTLYKMIGYTRDVISGKGEYALAYMMVHIWYKHFPELAQFALQCMVDLPSMHPYGSWKDIKYFCKYCESDSELVAFAVTLLNNQLRKDYAQLLLHREWDISLAAKWAPREKSAFGWLYQFCATEYFPNIMQTANTDEKKTKALLKCKMEYRKVLSQLNRHIDTVQIKQCEKRWAEIRFDKVTSVSLTKQRKAFLNVDAKGLVRYPGDMDRITCAEHFHRHVETKELKGQRVSMVDFTKQALHLLKYVHDPCERDVLNAQWRDNATAALNPLTNMIAMVDVSGSMDGDPLHAAIALGIRIAERSVIGNRVMTFSAHPTWVNLDDCHDFVSKVDKLSQAEFGMNTNFASALDVILDAIVVNKMHPDDVQDMVLVILSDMQMDMNYADAEDQSTLYKYMSKKYAETGIRVHGFPYKPPHILFWNLRSTTGFPNLSSEVNTSMMSGFSPSLLNVFCDEGITALHGCNPWSMLQKSLRNERYKVMQEKIDLVL
jgi:hypothetical protein